MATHDFQTALAQLPRLKILKARLMAWEDRPRGLPTTSSGCAGQNYDPVLPESTRSSGSWIR